MLRKHRCLGLLCLLVLGFLSQALTQEALGSEDEKEEDKRVYSGGRPRKYSSNSRRQNLREHPEVKDKKRNESMSDGRDCQRPEDPVNAELHCSYVSGCTVTCLDGYRLPNGNVRLSLKCVEGKWEIQNTVWTTVPACEPICDPECQNKGICTAPDVCDCPENYGGAQCQDNLIPCLNWPMLPDSVEAKCNDRFCTLNCREHHYFPDGSSVTNMLCKNGVWTPARRDWDTIPPCKCDYI